MKKGKFHTLKSMLIVSLIIALCLQLVAPSFAYAAQVPEKYAPTYEYISEKNAPVLYGTTAIKVPVGTDNGTLDLKHDARFRVFAKDNEDFDLTNKIVASHESVDTSAAGSFDVTYSVTDSHENTVGITVHIDVEEDREEIWLQKTMYTLPSVDHLNNTGHTRGNYMDRQIVGIFLDQDEDGNVGSFEMRKVSGAGNLTVPLQNNDGYCESTATVSNDSWQTIKNTGTTNAKPTDSLAAVPTVKTLYKETGSVVYEVKYDANDKNVKPLHYYHEGDGFAYETQFLEEWKNDKNSFAVVDGVSMMALMPYEDRAHVYSDAQRSFKSFDKMFEFWTEVLDSYDALIGISYTPDYYWNQAVKTKYFARANKHGAGGAYYNSGDCIGKNSSEMYSILCPWWGTLHEYGHGYQGNVGNSSYGLPITEVAVNIFSYYIQRLSGIYPYPNENWLGDIDKNETSWNNQRKSGITYYDSKIGSDTALYILINMLNTADDYMKAYAAVNQYYREVYFTTGVKMKTQDAWTLVFADKYNINLVPYFESWGVTVSDDVKNQMMLSDAEAVYYLDDMVSDSALASELKGELGNYGEYDLVKTSELAAKGLTGTVKITFNISNFENIKNKYLYINNGDQEVAKVQVTSQEMTLELPVGTYKVAPPRGNVPLNYDRFYMTVVNNTERSYEITYQDLDETDDGNDIRIQSRGYWEPTSEAYLPFVIETQGNRLVITYRGTRVRAAGTITVLGKDGEIKHTKSVSMSNPFWVTVLVDTYNIDVEIGDKLTIYYAGTKSDITATSSLTGKVLDNYKITDTATNSITYVVTKYGLVPETMVDDEDALYKMYKERVDSYIESLFKEHSEEYFSNPFINADEVNKATELVEKLAPEDKAPYAGIFTPGSAPVITFKEESYTYEAGTFDLNEFKKEITITDIEEKIIDVDSEEVKITSNVDAKNEGTYTIQVEVTDKQGNVTIATVTIVIIDSSKGETPENPENPGGNTPGGSDSDKKVCDYCGKVHSNSFGDSITAFFHKILYVFVHMFGKK